MLNKIFFTSFLLLACLSFSNAHNPRVYYIHVVDINNEQTGIVFSNSPKIEAKSAEINYNHAIDQDDLTMIKSISLYADNVNLSNQISPISISNYYLLTVLDNPQNIDIQITKEPKTPKVALVYNQNTYLFFLNKYDYGISLKKGENEIWEFTKLSSNKWGNFNSSIFPSILILGLLVLIVWIVNYFELVEKYNIIQKFKTNKN